MKMITEITTIVAMDKNLLRIKFCMPSVRQRYPDTIKLPLKSRTFNFTFFLEVFAKGSLVIV